MSQTAQLNLLAFFWFLKIVNLTLLSSVMLAGVLTFCHFSKRYSAGFKFLLLMSVLCSSVILPIIPTASWRIMTPPVNFKDSKIPHENPPIDTTTVQTEGYLLDSTPSPLNSQSGNSPDSRYLKIFIFWLSVTGLLIMKLLIGLIGMYRFLDRIKRCGKQIDFGLSNFQFWLVNDPAYSMPIACGLVNQFIVLPGKFLRLSSEKQKAVIFHEVAHVRRKDNLINLFGQTILALYWFNPLVWFTVHQLRILREQACDDYVLTSGIKPSTYAETLIESLSLASLAESISMVSNFSFNKATRLKYILDSGFNHHVVLGRTRTVTLLGLSLILVFLSGFPLFAVNDIAILPRLNLKTCSQEWLKNNQRKILEQYYDSQEIQSLSIEIMLVIFHKNHNTHWTSGLGILPVKGKISTPFGYSNQPVLDKFIFNNGIDIEAPLDAPIYASGKGEVIYSGNLGTLGNTIIINHGGNIDTLYAHASVLLVTKGSKVAEGETIAWVGSTGASIAPHLHFEFRVCGRPHNPAIWFRDRLALE